MDYETSFQLHMDHTSNAKYWKEKRGTCHVCFILPEYNWWHFVSALTSNDYWIASGYGNNWVQLYYWSSFTILEMGHMANYFSALGNRCASNDIHHLTWPYPCQDEVLSKLCLLCPVSKALLYLKEQLHCTDEKSLLHPWECQLFNILGIQSLALPKALLVEGKWDSLAPHNVCTYKPQLTFCWNRLTSMGHNHRICRVWRAPEVICSAIQKSQLMKSANK